MSLDLDHITLRLADQEDCSVIFNWRNDEQIRVYCFNTSMVEWNDHVQWFYNVLNRDDVVILIGEHHHEPVGLIRFDIKDNVATVSINVSPRWQGHGVAKYLLNQGERWLTNNISSVDELQAHIKSENFRSFNLFEAMNYTHYYSTYAKVIE